MNIWVNGCFDILHSGHIELLWYAKMYTDDTDPEQCYAPPNNTLFVGLDSDERVKKLKGDKRPINDINTRLTIMRSLGMVDEVFIFDNDDELRNLIKYCKIDYMVVGDQYKDKEVIGAENSKYGVVFYPVDKRSTTSIVEKLIREGRLQVYEEMYEKFKDDNTTIGINFNNFAVANLNKLKQ